MPVSCLVLGKEMQLDEVRTSWLKVGRDGDIALRVVLEYGRGRVPRTLLSYWTVSVTDLLAPKLLHTTMSPSKLSTVL